MPTPPDSPVKTDESASDASFPISEDEVRTALQRIMGEDEAQNMWLEACEAARAPRPGPELGPDEITRVVEHLKQQSGTASVVGTSLLVKIRVNTHR